MTIPKIITGGQTGAAQGALRAARELRIPTGGWMPRGFLTEDGPNPTMAELYGLVEHSSTAYKDRTLSNVLLANRVLVFGFMDSPGTRQTARFANKQPIPTYFVGWDRTQPIGVADPLFRQWIEDTSGILMVAGNRESKNPGIGEATYAFLLRNLGAKPC